MTCVENFALSYTFSICMKSKCSSSGKSSCSTTIIYNNYDSITITDPLAIYTQVAASVQCVACMHVNVLNKQSLPAQPNY